MTRGRKDLSVQDTRRVKVKELYLQGKTANEISKIVNCNYQTALSDINHWKEYYAKLATNNPHIVEKQVERINRLLDETEMVKKEFWGVYDDIKAQIEKEEAERAAALEKDPTAHVKQSSHIGEKLDTLKAIMNRMETEARLLNLFNPANLQNSNMISVEVLKEILTIVKNIITEFIPADKQGYAIERMKRIKLDPSNIIDVESKE